MFTKSNNLYLQLFSSSCKATYATIVNKDAVKCLDLTQQKIHSFLSSKEESLPIFKKLSFIPTRSDWEGPPRPILIKKAICQSFKTKDKPQHYYFGGLPALAQAARKLQENTPETVVYVNDGKISKAIQSGHQGHVHPSEWTTPDCEIGHLIVTLLQGMNLISPPSPENLERYSYLHFPIQAAKLMKDPLAHLSLYARFFKHRLLHTFSSENKVSADDRWLCDAVRESLDFYDSLNKEIQSEEGRSIFERGYRIYWSPHTEGMNRKKATWEALGIKCDWMSEKEIRQATLLNDKKSIKVLKIWGDGKFFPETPELIVSHLQKKYPRFKTNIASVSKIFLDEKNGEPLAVEETLQNHQVRVRPIKSFFGSPGHNQVYAENSSKPLWEEVPVSAISSLWVCTLEQEELLKKWRINTLDAHAIEERMRSMVASANLTNLHITIWDCVVSEGKVQLLVRATQGANFNSDVADKNDLINMMVNIEQFYSGTWRLISAGTCTRKTTVANVPTFQAGFLHGLSGIGYSFSAAPLEMMQRPSTALTAINLISKYVPRL